MSSSACFPAGISRDVVRALWTGHAENVNVPVTWKEAHAVFWQHPTSIIAAMSLLVMLGYRTQSTVSLQDLAVCLLGAAIWGLQEWLIHAKLFHGSVEWFGKDIHEGHHKQPYHHISIDACELAAPVIFLATALSALCLGPELGTSCAIGYVTLGLFYQFTHFAVHTRATPKSKFWRRLRQHHMQHHCRNENYWLAFTVIAMDDWMDTNPHPGDVAMTNMAKQAVKNKRPSSTCAVQLGDTVTDSKADAATETATVP